jgi:hypothetical protein
MQGMCQEKEEAIIIAALSSYVGKLDATCTPPRLGGHLSHAAVLRDVPGHPALVAHARLRAVLRLWDFWDGE